MTDNNDLDLDLEVYFKAAQKDAPLPSSDLLARIEADMDEIADTRPRQALPEPAKPSLFARILDSIGGWPALSGIATAGVVGVIVGISPPEAFSDITSAFLNGTTDLYLVDPYDGFGFESFEG